MKFYLSKEVRARGVTPLQSPRQGDAGYDLRSAEQVNLCPGSQALVRTGLHVSLPEGWVGLLRDRSSMAQKRIYLYSGVIDSSYRGEIMVILANAGAEDYHINVDDKIAQMVVVPHYAESPQAIDSLEELGATDRGQQGFGSTGVR